MKQDRLQGLCLSHKSIRHNRCSELRNIMAKCLSSPIHRNGAAILLRHACMGPERWRVLRIAFCNKWRRKSAYCHINRVQHYGFRHAYRYFQDYDNGFSIRYRFDGKLFNFRRLQTEPEMSHLVTKPAKWVCAQRWLRSAWACAHSDQSLRCALNGSLRTQVFFMRTAKTLIRLGGCHGWSESSLGAQPHCWFCHEADQMQLEVYMLMAWQRIPQHGEIWQEAVLQISL